MRVAMLLCAGLASHAAIAASGYAGRSLAEVLQELTGSGFRLIYNSSIVTPDLVVVREPTSDVPAERLRQLLEPLGLRARQVGGDIYAIVRVEADPRNAPQPATQAQPTAATPPLEEIVVAASRFRLAESTPDRHTYMTQAQLESLPRLGDDSLKALHRLPGAASNGLSGLAHLRGGEQNETLIVLDGLPLYEPFHLKNFQSATSVLDPRMLGAMDVHAGGFTAEFGDRMSAVVEASSVQPEEDRQYELGISVFHAHALATRRFDDGRGQWFASIRRSNLDEIADLSETPVGEPNYTDGFARVDYALTDATHASLSLLSSRDSIALIDEDHGETAEAHYRNTYVWATLEHDWASGAWGRAILSYSDVDNQRKGEADEPGRRSGSVRDHRNYDIAGLYADFSLPSGRWLHRFGFAWRELDASYDYQSVAAFDPGFPLPGSPGLGRETQLDPQPSGSQYAAYLTSRVRIGERITAELGLRWDDETYDDEDADDQLAPRVSLRYDHDDATRIRASWGRYQQYQAINELQVEDGIDTFHAAQRADHYIVGVERDLTPAVSLRIEAYRKDYDRPATRFENAFDPLSLLPELQPDRVRISPDSSRAEGVETLVSWRSARAWNGWASYTWSRAEDEIDGEHVPRSWDQTHAIGLGLQWASGPWDATAAFSYHTGWPTTRVRLTDATAGDGSPPLEFGPRNGDRFADFASLDLRVSRIFALRHGVLNVFAEVTNALDRGNPCCVNFSLEASDGRWVLDRDYDNWLPLVPSIGVRWTF